MFKKELYETNTIETLDRLKNLLRNQGIDYKVVVHSGGTKRFYPSILVKKNRKTRKDSESKHPKMYSIYVSKNDFEVAQLLLNQIK